MNRKDGLEKLVTCGKIEGRRDRRRQRTSYVNSQNRFATDKNLPNNLFIQFTESRKGLEDHDRQCLQQA